MTVQEAKDWLNELKGSEEILEFYYVDNFKEALDMAIKSLEEVEQYRTLGTVEELKEAREKQVAKKVISWQGKKHICPFCHRDIVRTEALDVHCKYCGQAFKWGEEE